MNTGIIIYMTVVILIGVGAIYAGRKNYNKHKDSYTYMEKHQKKRNEKFQEIVLHLQNKKDEKTSNDKKD